MDTMTNTIEQSILDDAFDSTPEEVFDFITSPAYTILLNGIQKILELTDEQKEKVRYASYNLLLKLKKSEEIYEYFIASGMNEELAIKALVAIQTEILERAANITEIYTDPVEPENEIVPIEKVVTPLVKTEEVKEATVEIAQEEKKSTPNDVLATLSDRLAKTQPPTPIVSPKNEKRTVAPQTTQTKRFDPYREMPEL
jgi:hypothetical protein